jgi:dipeptidyl aminopeptidase/acylaminoacyl peptidase
LVKFKTFDGREIPAWYYKPIRLSSIRKKLPIGSTFSLAEPENGILDDENTIARKHYIFWPNSPFVIPTHPADNGIPVIVSVHGGPEGQERPGFSSLYQYFLSRGYAILAPNVRGSTGYGKAYTHLDDVRHREESVKDLSYAVQWLRKSGGADPKRIAVMGGSYGGYMTLAAITLYPDLWSAAVDTVGIANWESFLKNTSGYRRRQREVEYGMLDKDIDFLRSISPIAKVDRIKAPLFVIAGKNDPRVPYTEAEQMVGALRKRGAVVEYKLYDDEGHGIAKLKNRLELYPLVADFLDKYMK